MEILEAKAKMENPEMMHFLKTLKICKELKWAPALTYIQDIKRIITV